MKKNHKNIPGYKQYFTISLDIIKYIFSEWYQCIIDSLPSSSTALQSYLNGEIILQDAILQITMEHRDKYQNDILRRSKQESMNKYQEGGNIIESSSLTGEIGEYKYSLPLFRLSFKNQLVKLSYASLERIFWN